MPAGALRQAGNDHLGRPALAVVGDVASSLEGPTLRPVDWITRDDALFDGAPVARPRDQACRTRAVFADDLGADLRRPAR